MAQTMQATSESRMTVLKSRIKSALPGILTVGLVAFLYIILGIGCPIRFVTGISCPGCGMTRAWLALLHGDVVEAFHFHPLFLLPLAAVMVLWFQPLLPRRAITLLLLLFIVILLIVYVIRLCDPRDTIVTLEPENGFFVRLLRHVLQL